MQKRAGLDMTEGPILRKLILFSLPLILNSVLNQLYSTADTVMMGRFAGTLAMAAVGASGQPLNLLVNLFAGIAVGVTVNCGNLKGAKKDKELSDCMHTCVLVGLLLGGVISGLGLSLCGPLLRSMDTPTDILDNALLYMRIRLAFGPIWMLATFSTHILHAFGETRIPTVVGIFSGLLNVCLNALFVPILGMGVEGVALATGASQTATAVVLTAVLFSPKGPYKMTFSGLRLHWEHVVNILTVGIPNGLSNIVFSVSNVLLQSAINRFGSIVIAGNTAANEVLSYVIVLLAAVRSACVSATAQCCGAKNYKRVYHFAGVALPAGIGVLIVLNILFTLFGKQMMTLITGDPAVAELGYPRLMITCWGYILFTLVKVFGGCLAGMKKSTAVLLSELFGIILPRLLWVWFVVPHMQSITWVYLIYPVSWLAAGILTAVLFRYYLQKLQREQLASA